MKQHGEFLQSLEVRANYLLFFIVVFRTQFNSRIKLLSVEAA